MFTQSSHLYDLIYSFKDYRQEAEQIRDLIRPSHPEARTILDVACGTGEHHRYLQSDFAVDGLDLNPVFLDAARKKNPRGTYSLGDMTDFQLPKQYDVVLCLFSSIGYAKTLDKVTAAFRCFARCLHEGGLVIVEPWITPENWNTPQTHLHTYQDEQVKICRMSHSTTEGMLSILNFHYLVGTREDGVRHFEEKHETGLFTVAEMKQALLQAGFSVSYDPEGLTGRGLYVGTRN